MSVDNEREKKVFNLIDERLGKLNCGFEDAKLIAKLVESYFRKRTNISNSKPDITAAGILWAYSKINFLWEGDKKWGCQNLADLFGVKAKTLGNKASEVSRALKIQLWDPRFTKETVAKDNPFNKFVITPSGMITQKETLPPNIPFTPLRKNKGDYFYDGLDYLDDGEIEKGIRFFKKALEIDEEYIDAYNGLGNAYLLKEDFEKTKEYYLKAYKLTKEHFKGIWPNKLPWGILENRQYLRAICGFGLCLWKENNFQETKNLFMLLLNLNPPDNQGIRYLVASILKGLTFEKYGKLQDKALETANYKEIDKLFEEQNKIHGFYKFEENSNNFSDDLWSKGSYIKSINPNDPDFKESMKYFEEKSDDKKEHNCKKCNKPIGKHNLYWHESMCNDCFFDEHGM